MTVHPPLQACAKTKFARLIVGGSGMEYKASTFCRGASDEVRISNVARYRSSFLASIGFPNRYPRAGFVPGDEGQGGTVHDTSGNGHHAKIIGAKRVTSFSR